MSEFWETGEAGLACYIQLDMISPWRPVRFLGDSLKRLRDFAEAARHDAGYQLDKVQRAAQPDDFKPLAAVGKGVEEVRITDRGGAYRVLRNNIVICEKLTG